MCKGTDKAAGKDLSSHILGRHTDKETINKVLTPPTEYEDKVFDTKLFIFSFIC